MDDQQFPHNLQYLDTNKGQNNQLTEFDGRENRNENNRSRKLLLNSPIKFLSCCWADILYENNLMIIFFKPIFSWCISCNITSEYHPKVSFLFFEICWTFVWICEQLEICGTKKTRGCSLAFHQNIYLDCNIPKWYLLLSYWQDKRFETCSTKIKLEEMELLAMLFDKNLKSQRKWTQNY